MGGPSGVTYAYKSSIRQPSTSFFSKATTSDHDHQRGQTHLRQPPINNKVRPVNKATLIARQEQHRLRLLDSLTEAPAGEVDLAAMALGRVVAEPVLQERRTAGKPSGSVYPFSPRMGWGRGAVAES